MDQFERIYRMKKEQAVFVDSILESHEGLCSFSVFPRKIGQSTVDMVLLFSPSQEAELDRVLQNLQVVLGETLIRVK